VQQSDDGKLIWIDDDQTLTHEPASHIQRLEDWFLGLLPIDAEM
jgi:putative cardiolipin synthase